MHSLTKKLTLLGLSSFGVYAFLIFSGFNGAGMPMGDLNLAYQQWVDSGLAFGLSVDWVYPYPALMPMLLANMLAPGQLIWPWLIISAITTAAITVVIAGVGKTEKTFVAMYYWLAATVMLGPVAVSRLDTFSVSLAVLAVFLLVRGNLAGASIWLSVATWIKVWPVAMIAALFAAAKNKLNLLTVILLTNIAILLVGFVIGADASIFSFLTQQSGRGIQIEAPIAAFWLWPAVLGDPNFGITYSATMMTFEVFGANVSLVANLMSLVQLGALAITFALAFMAQRRGATLADIVFWASFTGILDLIVFNKVGSPQYMTWLVVPMVFGILAGVSRMRVVAVSMLFVSGLTWLIYPVLYNGLLQGGFGETFALTLRNLLLVAGLVYANLRLQKLGK